MKKAEKEQNKVMSGRKKASYTYWDMFDAWMHGRSSVRHESLPDGDAPDFGAFLQSVLDRRKQ